MSERKISTNPLVPPARLSGAAAENCAHRYIENVCSGRGPEPGHGELLKLLRVAGSQRLRQAGAADPAVFLLHCCSAAARLSFKL